MTVPQQVPFSAVPVAGVLTFDGINYLLKTDPSNAVNLGSAAATPIANQSQLCNYYPAAALSLGAV